ncbi:MAG: hypothetical protein B6I18_09335 [Bacteroidetes bacterium 4572_112]|nr:MAG: hypothetical protein B6I18_09335 [Bacteroidetes bacterium 4572_112]
MQQTYNHKSNHIFISLSKVFILMILMTFSFESNAQKNTIKSIKTKCINALKTNDIGSFVSTFSNPVDISLPDNENSYSKTQAKVVMKEFLQKNKTKSFKVKQSGKSTGGSEFVIANLTTKNDLKYQIYILITVSDDEANVHMIEFELLDN